MTGTLSAVWTAAGLELAATTPSETFSALWAGPDCDVLLLGLLVLGDLDKVLFLEEELDLCLDLDLDLVLDLVRDSDGDLDGVYERRLERETLLEREYDLPLDGDGVEVQDLE